MKTHTWTLPLDQSGLRLINGLAGGNHVLDKAGVFLASYGAWMLAVVLVLIWFLDPGEEGNVRRVAVAAGVAIIVALVLNAVLAHLVPFQVRPFAAEPKLVHDLIHHPPDDAFPSDHTAVAFAAALTMTAGRRDYRALILWAVLVGLSRIFVGAHWPSDVWVGALDGAAAALISTRWLGTPVLWINRVCLWLVSWIPGVARPS